MLHHMGLGKGNNAAGFERNDRDMHVVAHVVMADKARRRPNAVGIRHGNGLDIFFIHHEGFRNSKPFDKFIRLANPMETHGLRGCISHAPFHSRRNEGIATGLHNV